MLFNSFNLIDVSDANNVSLVNFYAKGYFQHAGKNGESQTESGNDGQVLRSDGGWSLRIVNLLSKRRFRHGLCNYMPTRVAFLTFL